MSKETESKGNIQSYAILRGSNSYLFCILCYAVFFAYSLTLIGCQSSKPNPIDIPEQKAQEIGEQSPTNPDSRIFSPLEEWPDDEKWLGEQWRNFFKSGRYRLINPQEMKLSEGAKSNMYSPSWKYFVHYPYVRWCQGIGAIVVDTTRTDDKRYGLVFFPSGWLKIPLKPVWLIRNKDLSRTVLNQTSCSMFVRHYAEDGSVESHEFAWDSKKKKII